MALRVSFCGLPEHYYHGEFYVTQKKIDTLLVSALRIAADIAEVRISEVNAHSELFEPARTKRGNKEALPPDEESNAAKAAIVCSIVDEVFPEAGAHAKAMTVKPSTPKQTPARTATRARRSDNTVDALELRIVDALAGKDQGLSAEELRRMVAVERGPFGVLIRRAKERGLVRVQGERRGTRYFSVDAPYPSTTPLARVVRRRLGESARASNADGIAAA